MESAALRADSLATLDLARARRLPHLHPLLQATQPGEITYVDVVSASHLDLPSSVDGKSLGFKHCLVFVDAFSGHIRVYFAKKQDEVPTLTRFYLQELGTTLMFGSTFQIRRIHTDGGLPLNNSDFERVLLDYGLAANVTTCPRTPSSNGVAEAAIKYLIQGTAQRLAISGLCKRAWTWAMRHAAVARNKLATRQLDDGRYVTPHELFYGRAPSLSHSVIFGAPCSVLLLGPDRDTLGKFGVPAEKGHVLGHGEDGFQWLGTYRQAMGYVVLLGSNKVVFTKHCRIDERVFAEGGAHTHTFCSRPFAAGAARRRPAAVTVVTAVTVAVVAAAAAAARCYEPYRCSQPARRSPASAAAATTTVAAAAARGCFPAYLTRPASARAHLGGRRRRC